MDEARQIKEQLKKLREVFKAKTKVEERIQKEVKKGGKRSESS